MGLRKPLVLAALQNLLLMNFRNKKLVMYIDIGTMGVLPPKSGLVMEGAEFFQKANIVYTYNCYHVCPCFSWCFSVVFKCSAFLGLANII